MLYDLFFSFFNLALLGVTIFSAVFASFINFYFQFADFVRQWLPASLLADLLMIGKFFFSWWMRKFVCVENHDRRAIKRFNIIVKCCWCVKMHYAKTFHSILRQKIFNYENIVYLLENGKNLYVNCFQRRRI
jgi:hypothetical protein